MDELQTGVKQSLAVLPQPPVLFQPGEAALHHPALGYDLEGVQFAALGYLYRDVLAQDFPHALRERLPHIAAVGQQALYSSESRLAATQGLQRTLAIRHLCRGYRDRMRQTLRVHSDMALDAGNLLPGVIPLQLRRVRVLHALRVHDQERAAGVAPLSLAGRANLIF